MSSDGSDMLNLQVRRSLYTSGACLNARSPGWVGHGGQGYTHTLSLGAGGSAASRARRAGTEGMASGGRIDEFFYGAMASLEELIMDDGGLGTAHPALKATCEARGIVMV